MKKRRFPHVFLLLCLAAAVGVFWYTSQPENRDSSTDSDSDLESALDTARSWLSQEPEAVQELRDQDVVQNDEGHQEYYFQLLGEDERRVYREMLDGIRKRNAEFYLTTGENEMVDKVYHALLKDHPELFWIHNRESVYKTTYDGEDYSLFSPGYTYTDEEIGEIQQSMEEAYQEVASLAANAPDSYEKVKAVYTYLIDNTEYVSSEHDQNIAGVFWKKQAVCAGYARAMQYLLERLDIPCVYVEGSTAGSTEGHAWNIVQLDGQYYYVDATNGDQPEFLEGDAVQLAEHKTIIYDYLCPFPEEYEMVYTPSDEFPVPDCTAVDKNFYVLNQGCFDSYDRQQILDYCKMRLNNGAAVVRFKFTNQEAYDAAYQEWIQGGYVQEAAEYYLQLYGMSTVEYHYGILQNMKTIYLMF
ncbi:MAG TPA: transglutaminase-like superfamily [Candidatus Blautia excrementipullorum]|nr:transglutaminase-like superfamily [Candidatus Blautia excrementipullorum]